MKIIGIIGGMSWESSLLYYRLINQGVKQRLGGLHCAKILMYSVDFAQIEALQHQGDWQGASKILIDAAQRLEAGGADFFIIATNTMHYVADAIRASVKIPLLHIGDATAQALQFEHIETVGLLGTAFTMEYDFYKQHIIDNYGIHVVVPGVEDRKQVHHIIYKQLCLGRVLDESRQIYLDVIQRLAKQGVQGVILGCTEIGMLIKKQHTNMRLFDTTEIHAKQAVNLALASD